jgi:hypothetical protein
VAIVPRFTPEMVMLELPEDATFDLLRRENVLSSNEKVSDVFATAPVAPSVMDACSVVPILVVILHDTEDTEIHEVASHPV